MSEYFLFIICVPWLLDISSLPKYEIGKCLYINERSEDCNLIVYTDNYLDIDPNKLSLYMSVESPLTRLSNTDAFDYTATISSDSDYQLTAWTMPSLKEYNSPNPNPHRNGKGVIFISNCIEFRIKMVSDICQEGFKIDVYGACYVKYCNNIKRKDRYSDKWRESKKNILTQYSYVLAIENAKEDNYVTEKLYDALLTHTLPFYWGADNVHEFIPHPDSIITNLQYLKEVLSSDELYTYHTEGWRNSSLEYNPLTLTFNDVLKDICEKRLKLMKI